MELIFDIIDQSGRSHQYRKLSGDRLTIGRAWDNDLVLADPAVNAHHAVIDKDENNQLLITDLESLNGTHVHKQSLTGSAALLVGEQYVLGKTRIYIYTPDHAVAEAVKIADMDNMVRHLDDPRLLAGSMVLVALFYAGEQWLNMFSGFKWQEVTNILLFIFGAAIGIALVWAVIGRVLRHETEFRKQFCLILLLIAAQFVLAKLFAVFMFNTLDFTLGTALLVLAEFVLLTTTLWFNLYLATNQPATQRTWMALVIGSAMIVLSLYTEITARSEFSESPEYVKVLLPPILHFGSGVTEDEFLAGTADVFSRLQQD